MKKLFLFIALLIPMVSVAQDDETMSSSKQTTFEKFTSTIGEIVRFKDYELPEVKGKVGTGLMSVTYIVYANVREVIIGNNKSLFLRLRYRETPQSSQRMAFIAYEDVIEIDKALTELVKQGENDSRGEADYLENKFRTKDDFEIGYYIDKKVSVRGKESNDQKWYVDLDIRYNKSTAFFPTPDGLINLFKSAIQKMNELK